MRYYLSKRSSILRHANGFEFKHAKSMGEVYSYISVLKDIHLKSMLTTDWCR